MVSGFGSGAYSAKPLAGTKQRLSGFNHARQCGDEVLRMLVTGDSLGSHGLAEAKALIIRHRDVVLAVANALMIHRALDAVMNRKIIASAPERARRADWKIVEKNAADFAARGFDG
jgi:hypothetical protein